MIKYWVLPHSITVKIGEKSWIISSSDVRFEKIKEYISSNRLDLIENEIDFVKKINIEGFEVSGNQILYKKNPFPQKISDDFFSLKLSHDSFIGLANIWTTLYKHKSFKDAENLISKILELKAYSLSKDGYIFVHPFYSTNSDLPLYSYSHCYNKKVISFFEERKDINQLISTFFKNDSKKLRKIINHKIFSKGKVNENFLILADQLKEILVEENIIKIIETADSNFKINKDITEVFHQFSKDQLFKYLNNPDISAFIEKCKHISESLSFIRRHLNYENWTIPKVKNIKEMEEIVSHTFKTCQIEYVIFELTEKEKKADFSEIELYKSKMNLVIPKNSFELADWSDKMNNCVKGYSQRIFSGKCKIYAIYKNFEVFINIGIENGHVFQIATKHNRNVDPETFNFIVDFLKEKELL